MRLTLCRRSSPWDEGADAIQYVEPGIRNRLANGYRPFNVMHLFKR